MDKNLKKDFGNLMLLLNHERFMRKEKINDNSMYLIYRNAINRQIFELQKQKNKNISTIMRLKHLINSKPYNNRRGYATHYSFRPTTLIKMSGKDIKECFNNIESLPLVWNINPNSFAKSKLFDSNK